MKAQRTCLRCGKLFASAGPGNRICGKCGPKADAAPRILMNVFSVQERKTGNTNSH